MERVVRGRSFTLTKTFYVDGAAADPTGTPTVTITRADGTPVTAGAVVNEPDVGVFSVTVPAASNTILDELTVTWTATVGGEPQEYVDTVEVAGGVLFTVAQARAIKPLNDTTRYTTQQIIDMRTVVETALEHACDVAFVPRAKIVRVLASGSTVGLGVNRVRSVSSVTDYQGNATDLSSTWMAGGVLVGSLQWPSRPLVVRVEHGYDYPPPDVSQAALLLAKNWLIKGPIDDRATSVTTDDGTFSMATPGLRGARFGIPDVDAVVAEYRQTAYVA